MPRQRTRSCPRTCVGAAHLFLGLCGILSATAASAGPVNGGASVTILMPVTAHEEAPLAFGSIDATTSAVVVTVRPDGTVQCSVASLCKGSAAPAIFALTGTPGDRVGVSVTDHVTLTSAAGDSLVATLALAGSEIDLVPGANRVAIGGEITVPAGQSPGQYEARFDINVSYQ